MSIKNLEKFFDWAHTTGRAQVIHIKSNSRQLRSLLDPITNGGRIGSAMQGFSDQIEHFRQLDAETKQRFAECEHWEWNNDEDLYACYRIAKKLWLLNDIRDNGIMAPMQIINSGRYYTCHPGGDKKIATVFLQDLEEIELFYIWYPEVDQQPFFWSYDNWQQIHTPKQLASIFKKSDDPRFNWHYEEVVYTAGDEGYEYKDDQFGPWAKGMAKWLRKFGKYKSNPSKFRLVLPSLSYTDTIHREAMIEYGPQKILNQCVFKGDIFMMGDLMFKKKADGWLYEGFDHYPKSLVDTDFRHDPDKARVIYNTRNNISRLRNDL